MSAQAIPRLLAHLALAVVAVLLLAWATHPDPCAGHVTPDGITADAMGPCDEMPGVPRVVALNP